MENAMSAMSETTTGTDTRSRTTKRPSPSREEVQFPPFEMAKMEIPEVVRDAATKWINQGKENLEKAFKATEEMNYAFERALSSATKGAVDCSAKCTEATRTNAVAAFDIAHDFMSAKSLSEAIEVSTTGARKQFESLTAQNQELWALTQQLVTETIKPIAGGLPKMFSPGMSS
jgi:phasin